MAAPEASKLSTGSTNGTYAATWGGRPTIDTYGESSTAVPGIGALRRGRLHAHLADVFDDQGGAAARARDIQARDDAAADESEATAAADGTEREKPKAQKFGMLDGVLARCLVQIWGVIIFIRLGWLTAYGGILLTIAVVVISATITTITTLSLSAIATNGRVKGGGAYFLISRSLGPELGGAIGVLFAAANAVAIALYLIGLAETVVSQLNQAGVSHWISPEWDLRVIAFISLGVLTVLVFVGISVVIKFQLGLLLLLILAFSGFIAGTFMDSNREGADPAQRPLAVRNWLPAYDGLKDQYPEAAAALLSTDGPVSFATCLAIFFPAATGIMAGANISGDLKNPRTAIPNGTLLAIAISTVVYIGLVILVGSATERIVQLPDGSFAGLYFDTDIMAKLSAEPWLVNLGVYAATISSALASLVGAPRILQAVAKDNLFPFLRIFGNGYGGNDEPLQAYALSVIIAAACIAIGDLNLVAPLVTSLFLLSYFLVNYACLAAEISRSPGWRPTFRYYSKYTAALGALACIIMLFFLDYVAGIISVVITGGLWYYVKSTTASTVNWGSASEGSAYMAAVRTLSRLQRTQRHVKNWRPQFLVLVGGTLDARLRRAGLVHFMRHLQKGKGVTVFARVLSDSFEDYCARKAELFPGGLEAANEIPRRELLRWLHRLRAPGFAQAIVSPSLRTGAQALLQLGGLGQLRPNVVVLGGKQDWRESSADECDEFVGLVGDSFDMDCGVVLMYGVPQYEKLTCEHDDHARAAKRSADKVRARLERDAPSVLHADAAKTHTEGIETAAASAAVAAAAATDPDAAEAAAATVLEGSGLTAAASVAEEEADASGLAATAVQVGDVSSSSAAGATSDDAATTAAAAAATATASAAATDDDDDDDDAAHGGRGGHAGASSSDVVPKLHAGGRQQSNGQLLSPSATPQATAMARHSSIPDLMELFEREADEGGNAAVTGGQGVDEDEDESAAASRGGLCGSIARMCGARLAPGQGTGRFIDIWWLSDDGGLTVMLPHLLSRSREWRGAKLRVFVVHRDEMLAVRQQREMTELLQEVRIAAEVQCVHNDTPLAPQEAAVEAHAQLGVERVEGEVSDQSKAYLRMGELIREHSADASFVFVSLPVPRQGQPSRRYLAWLDALSSLSTGEHPVPVALVRGNNRPVLTFFT